MEQKNKFIYILPVMFGFFIMGFGGDFCNLCEGAVPVDRNTSRLFAVNGIFVVFYLVCTYSHVNEPDRTKKYSIIEYAVHFRRHGIAFH